MARMMIVGAPQPRELLLGYCAVCCAEYKWALITDDQVAGKITAASATAEGKPGKPMIVPVPAGFVPPPVELAVCMAPVKQFGGAVAPVCWTHCPALEPPQPPPANGDGQPGPGLLQSGPLPGLGHLPEPRRRGRDA